MTTTTTIICLPGTLARRNCAAGGCMPKMTTLPSTTVSTSKAHTLLARRRAQRRQKQLQPELLNKTVEESDSEEKEEDSSSSEPKDTLSPQDTPSPQRQQQQQEQITVATPATPTRVEAKAYNHLTQRRAKRRQQQRLASSKNNKTRIVEIVTKQLNMSEPKRLIVLVSKGVSDRSQAANQSRAMTLLKAKRTPFVEVDGMDLNQREKRNELFGISGIRANYPQFFLEDKDGTITFIGKWDTIEEINDSSGLPAETLKAHPQILTWESIFGTLVESFDD